MMNMLPNGSGMTGSSGTSTDNSAQTAMLQRQLQLQQLQMLEQQQQILAMRRQLQSQPSGEKKDRATILAENKAAAERRKADALARRPVVARGSAAKKPVASNPVATTTPIDVVGASVATR